MAECRANADQKYRAVSEDNDAWKIVFDDIGTKTVLLEDEDEEAGREGRGAVSADWPDPGAHQDGSKGQPEDLGSAAMAREEGQREERETVVGEGKSLPLLPLRGRPMFVHAKLAASLAKLLLTSKTVGGFFHQVMADLKSRGVKVLDRSGDTWGGGKSSGYRWEDGKTKFRIYVPIP